MLPVFILEEPSHRRVKVGESNRFRGVVLGVDGRDVDRVSFVRAGKVIGETAVDQPCPELAWLTEWPRATSSRFIAEIMVEPGETIEIRGGDQTLFVYDVPFLERNAARLAALREKISALPFPPGDVVATTQGGTDVESYRDSILSGVITTEQLLRESGVDAASVRDVLDVGCGTGRLLAGWYCDDPARRLVGADINEELIAWNRANLPEVAEWHASALYPPLDVQDSSFDLVIFCSVFTHLPLDCQRAWVAETLRVLRPGGAAMISLHGETYARLLLDPPTRERYAAEGHLQFAGAAEGANAYSTFHTPAFARELFTGFAHIAMHPRGDVQRGLFPVASLQDVWILKKKA